MKIIVDAFGGDNAPLEILRGCEMAVSELDVDILLTGDEQRIRACAEENGISLNRCEIVHAPTVVAMDDHADAVIKSKKDSSLAEAMRQLAAGNGDAVVSAGSTGAVLMGGTFIVKRIKGIKRAALATLLPTDDGRHVMLLDSGANADCRPEILAQFAVMGNEYMRGFFGIEQPRVGLLNVGTEDTKGDVLRKETFEVLKSMDLNFIGNVEARDVLAGVCDVLVADGFAGNVLLKGIEGAVSTIMKNLKEVMYASLFTKLAALVLKPGLRTFKHKLDYTEVGGAPLIGVAAPVIKAHGNSKAKAFKNAIKQAAEFAASGAVDAIKAAAKKEKESDNA